MILYDPSAVWGQNLWDKFWGLVDFFLPTLIPPGFWRTAHNYASLTVTYHIPPSWFPIQPLEADGVVVYLAGTLPDL